MKRLVIAVSTVLILSACMTTKPTKAVIELNNVEEILSYQDIITQINKINTSQSNNKRTTEIIKEYKYSTSDDDSKNSARKKALNQVKILILEEIGVFVESYLELNTLLENKKYQKSFKQEIKNLTAGIIKTKIIDEKYDGATYYVKASVLVDPDSVSEGITEILKIKANKSEINKLTKLLESKEKEMDMRNGETISLQKKLTNQELLNMAKEKELKLTQEKLNKTQLKLKKYEAEEIKLQGELSQIEKKVNQAMQRIQKQSKKACMVKLGMTMSEVRKIIGAPTAVSARSSNTVYLYGNVNLIFHYITDVLIYIQGCPQ